MTSSIEWKYKGEVNESGNYHGKGSLYRIRKRLKFFKKEILDYYGEFVNGVKHGSGRLFHSNGVVKFYGKFQFDRKNGVGVLFNQKGIRIKRGIWEDDEFVRDLDIVSVDDMDEELTKEFEENVLDLKHKERKKLIRGDGSFAKVYEFHSTINDFVYAFKYFSVSNIDVELIQRETRVLGSLDNPYIIKLYAVSLKEPIGILTELCDCSVHDLLVDVIKKKKTITFEDKIKIIFDTAMGMEYLHLNKLVHRDLKWKNCLIKDEKDLSVKIADFGFAKISESFRMSRKDTNLGTPEYMAPEISSGRYTRSCDCFSFGIMLYECFFETVDPYNRKSNPLLMPMNLISLIKNGLRPKIPKVLPNEVKNNVWLVEMIKKLWNKKPEKRMTFTDVIRKIRENSDIIVEKKVSLDRERVLDIKGIQNSKLNRIFDEDTKEAIEFSKITQQYKNHIIQFKDLKLKKYIGGGGCTNCFLGLYNEKNITFCSINTFTEVMNYFRMILHVGDHKHIIKCIGTVLEKNHHGTVSEFATYGNIKTFFNGNPKIPLQERIRLCYEVALAMKHVHERGVIFRDLNPSQILIGDDLSVKVKLSIIMHKSKKRLTMYIGTEFYQAPEVTKGDGMYDSKIDVWSYAITINQILNNDFNIMGDKYYKYIPDLNLSKIKLKWLKDLIQMNLNVDPSKRMNFSEIVELFEKRKVLKKAKFFPKARRKSITIYVMKPDMKVQDSEDFELRKFTLEGLRNIASEYSGLKTFDLYLYVNFEKKKKLQITNDEDVYKLENDSLIVVDGKETRNIVVYFKKEKEDDKYAEDYLLRDFTIKGLYKLAKEYNLKQVEKIILKNYKGYFIEMKTDEDVKKLENDSMLIVYDLRQKSIKFK